MKFIIKSSILFPKILLNYNCKEEEKSGSGPGSCSGASKDSSEFLEPPKAKEFRSQYESVLSDIRSNLDSMVQQVKQEIQQERKGSKYHPIKDKWNKLSNNFQTARKEYVSSLNGKIARAPESEYTAKLKPVQIQSANKLRDVSAAIFEKASPIELDAIKSEIIDSYTINDLLLKNNIPDVGKIPNDALGDIENESTKVAIQKLYGMSEDQILQKTVGALSPTYWNTPEKRPSWTRTAYQNFQSEIKDIAGLDSIMQKASVPEELEVYSGVTSNVFSTSMKVGDEIQLKAYLSTSRLKPVASGFAKYKKEGDGHTVLIKLKPGTHALALEDKQHSDTYFDDSIYPEINWTLADPGEGHGWVVGESGRKNSGGNQREVLVNRNTKFRVTKSDGKNLVLETIP